MLHKYLPTVYSMQFLDTEAAFALRAKQLVDRLYEQMADALNQRGLRIISKTMGIVQLLYSEGPHSQADIAARLRYSHQLTAQRLNWLYKNDFAVAEPDPQDRRRNLINLTASGRREGEKLQQFLPHLLEAYHDLFDEIQIDLDSTVQLADTALRNRSLTVRMTEQPSRASQ